MSDNDRQKLEQLAEKHSTPDWVVAGMKTHAHWGEGHEVYEEDFLRVRDEVLGLRFTVSFPYPVPPK